MIYYYTYSTMYGDYTYVEEDGNLIEIQKGKVDKKGIYQQTDLLDKVNIELDEYFKGMRKEFDIPYKLNGTDFQIKVWKALTTIPYGKTVTYKDIAILVGNEKASRAIGMANHNNPIPFIIPCHRVIGKNGKLTGYGLGLDLKEKLLKMEGN